MSGLSTQQVTSEIYNNFIIIIIIFGHFNFIFEVVGNGCILIIKAKGPLLSASAIFNAFEIIDIVYMVKLNVIPLPQVV